MAQGKRVASLSAERLAGTRGSRNLQRSGIGGGYHLSNKNTSLPRAEGIPDGNGGRLRRSGSLSVQDLGGS